MVSENTILTKTRLKDIEDIIISSGKIISTADINETLGAKYSKFTVKKRIYELKKKGWLVPLKRGLYFVADLTSLGFVSVSPLVIASAFDKDSYISLESGLSYYNLFEQMRRTTVAVTPQKTKHYKFQNNLYQYLKVKKELYFGFKTVEVEGFYIKVAELEKVILDYLYFRADTYALDLLVEKIEKSRSRIRLDKLYNYARKFPSATRRKLGFILDLVDLDTEKLHSSVGRDGYSKLTPLSRKFNARWRIYYEDRFIKPNPA